MFVDLSTHHSKKERMRTSDRFLDLTLTLELGIYRLKTRAGVIGTLCTHHHQQTIIYY